MMSRLLSLKQIAICVTAFLFLSWKTPPSLDIPVVYYKLPNGMKVVLSPDKTSPTIAVGIYYNIGFRIEPRNRTGFAHLFEHMMFQGSKNMPKGEFDKLVERNGGWNNGSTRFDYTNYFEVLPAHMLKPILWAEADRMKGLAITQESLANQQGVVKNEVFVNVINQPYGGFPWLDVPQVANVNWYNAHNFYGDLADLDSAKLEDVDNFFKTYYAPNNAVLVVVGDIDTTDAKKWIDQYFSEIPRAEIPPVPDLTEPPQLKEKRAIKEDTLANKPAIAVAYKMPKERSPEYYAMGLIDQLMVQGNDSKLNQALVQEKGITNQVFGGINFALGDMYNYNGPMLWTTGLLYDSTVSADTVISEYEKAITEIKNNVTEADLKLAMVKIRSQLYDKLRKGNGTGKLDLLAVFALFNDDPRLINGIEEQFEKITTGQVKKTAAEYLRPENRTILMIQPKASNK